MAEQLDLLPPPILGASKGGRPLSVPPINLEIAKALVTSGVPYDYIAKKVGVDTAMIKMWASRYNWITPTKIEKRMRAELSQSEQVNEGENGKDTELRPEAVDPLTIAVEHAKKVGMSAMAGFVQRAAPSFNKFTPDVPETIGEASILLKMIKSAAGLESAQTQQTNVQVNVSTGPWGKASANGQSFRTLEAETEDD